MVWSPLGQFSSHSNKNLIQNELEIGQELAWSIFFQFCFEFDTKTVGKLFGARLDSFRHIRIRI